jgi:hypothetical protein
MKLRTSPSANPHHENIEHGPLMWPKIEQIIFQSFRHSQGYVHIQVEMFKYLKLLHPEWTMPEITEGMQTHLSNRLRAFLPKPKGMSTESGVAASAPDLQIPSALSGPHTHSPISDTEIKRSQRDLLEKLERQLGRDPSQAALTLREWSSGNVAAAILWVRKKLNLVDMATIEGEYKHSILHGVLSGILNRDQGYLLGTPFGRPRGLDGETTSPMLDPYFSFICTYLLQDKPTGLPEFDVMYDDMREFINASPRREMYLDLLRKLVAKHNEHHPDDQIEHPETLLGTIE